MVTPDVTYNWAGRLVAVMRHRTVQSKDLAAVTGVSHSMICAMRRGGPAGRAGTVRIQGLVAEALHEPCGLIFPRNYAEAALHRARGAKMVDFPYLHDKATMEAVEP